MFRCLAIVLLCGAAACDRLFQLAPIEQHDATVDNSLDKWSTPVQVVGVSGGDDPTLTGDLLELFFDGGTEIYRVSRANVTTPWSAATPVAELNSADDETTPHVSADGRTLYLASNRGGSYDIYRSTRVSRMELWSNPVHVPSLSSGDFDVEPSVSSDELAAVLTIARNTAFNIYTTSRSSPDEAWPPPVSIDSVNTAGFEAGSFLSSDGLTLYFISDVTGNLDIYQARRDSTIVAFDTPRPISELNTNADEHDPWVSPDGRTIFFIRNETTLMQATR